MPKLVRLHVTALAVCAALTGCTGSGDELDVDGFSSGPCADTAPALQDVDEVLRDVEDEDATPRQAADRLKAVQEALKPQVEGDSAVQEQVTDLVSSIGFLRLSVDTNSYDGSQADGVRDALDALAEACRQG